MYIIGFNFENLTCQVVEIGCIIVLGHYYIILPIGTKFEGNLNTKSSLWYILIYVSALYTLQGTILAFKFKIMKPIHI